MNRTQQKSALRRAASAVKRLFSRGTENVEWTIEAAPARERREEPKAAKPVQRQTDVPLDALEQAYTPPMTSSKASFRSDGSDHQLDQELVYGVAGAQWKDEDHFTNKSGDPRIGTHGRTNEPAEARVEEGD